VSFDSPISTGYLGHSLFANSTRIISATRTASLYWGRNAYIKNSLPLAIASCCLWLDATDTSTITLASTKVVSWTDKSTNAFVFNQTTVGSRPTYTSNSQNSLATLTFSATNSTYLLGPSNFSIGTSSYSLFVVCNITVSNATFCGIFNKSLYGAQNGRILMLQDAGSIHIQYTHPGDLFLSTTADTYTLGNYRIFELIVNRTEGKDYAYQNGTLLSTLTITDATNYTDTVNNMLIGAYNDGAGTGPGSCEGKSAIKGSSSLVAGKLVAGKR
jgi:hypothetical protein